MGGGGDKNYERKQIADEKDRSNQEYAAYQGAINSGRDTRDKQYNDTFDQTKQSLTGFTGNTGGLNQPDIDRLRGIYGANPSSSSGVRSGAAPSGGGDEGVISNTSGGAVRSGSKLNDVDIPKEGAFKDVGALGPSEAGNVKIPTGSSYDGLDTSYKSAIGDANSAYDGVNIDKTNYASKVGGPNLDKTKAGYGGLADTGGISDQDRSDVLRGSLLEQEKTGGYTPQDISRIRAKASNNAASTFGAVKDSLDRSRAVNGNTTGLSSTNFKLARETAKQQAMDKNNAEIGLADNIRANKADAGKFNSGASAGLIDQRNKTKLAGLGGLGAAEMSGAGFDLDKAKAADSANANINSNELAKASGKDAFGMGKAGLMDDAAKSNVTASLMKASGLDQATANQVTQQLARAGQMDEQSRAALNAQIAKATGLDQYTINSIQAQLSKASGLDQYDISQAQLSQSASNAASAASFREREANADNERWIMSQQMAGKQYGTSGLGDLTQLAGNQRLGYDQMYGNSLAGRSGAAQGAIGLNLQNDQQNQSKLGQYITGGLGSVAGIAGAFMNPLAKKKVGE